MDVPLSNITALQTEVHHGWMKVPLTRGTSDILYTCLFTIILCVYTAIHINIPAPSDSLWRLRLRLAKWTLIGILAPEIVLLAAWTQFHEARRFVQELSTLPKASTAGGVAEAPSPASDNFDLVYGFYAVMGGFRIRAEIDSANEVDAALSLDGILYLARNGVFCRISPKSIEDRSKADILAKALVLVQVTWMCAQCIARKATHLPLSLLEIHTVVHCICAAFIYALWFRKPQNIQEATYVSIPAGSQMHVGELLWKSRYRALAVVEQALKHDAPLDALGARSNNMGRAAMEDATSIGARFRIVDDLDIVSEGLSRDATFTTGGFLMQAAYGGIHLAAWQTRFPSTVEMWLWRSSGLAIVGFMPLIVLASLLLDSVVHLNERVIGSTVFARQTMLRWCWRTLQIVATIVLAAVFFAPILGVFFARGFLVIESFISLRAVPIGVYAAIPWADYIPHL